jgi:hypothetical protein
MGGISIRQDSPLVEQDQTVGKPDREVQVVHHADGDNVRL